MGRGWARGRKSGVPRKGILTRVRRISGLLGEHSASTNHIVRSSQMGRAREWFDVCVLATGLACLSRKCHVSFPLLFLKRFSLVLFMLGRGCDTIAFRYGITNYLGWD